MLLGQVPRPTDVPPGSSPVVATPPVRSEVLPAVVLPDGGVRVRYRLAAAVPDARLGLFDVRGRRLRVLDRGARGVGSYDLVWNRLDERGQRVARGVYWLELRGRGTRATRKLVLASE